MVQSLYLTPLNRPIYPDIYPFFEKFKDSIQDSCQKIKKIDYSKVAYHTTKKRLFLARNKGHKNEKSSSKISIFDIFS
jgi:hypothetical protein